MWVVVVIGAYMSFSGLVMHREIGGEWVPGFIDTGWMREMHNKLSNLFGLVLWGMIVTGLFMWAFPRLISRKTQEIDK